jgi:hypothetical protein
VTLAGSKIDSSKFYHVENLKTYIAVFLHVDYIMIKAKEPDVNIGIDTSQNKAVNPRW